MPEYRKILLPVDFSRSGRNAIAHGADLARGSGAEVIVLHILDIRYAGADYVMGLPNFQQFQEEVREHAEERLQKLVDEKPFDGIASRHAIVEGVPSEEILRVAEEEGADLIVMGTHGRTGLEHLVLGSTAERVVRLAPCPVLTVRAPEEGEEE